MLILPKTFSNLTEWAKRLVSVLETNAVSKDDVGRSFEGVSTRLTQLEARVDALENPDDEE